MIKSSISEEKSLRKIYPYIGYNHPTQLVLFTSKNTGILIWSKEKTDLGHHSDKWSEQLFNVFNGSLILSNESE